MTDRTTRIAELLLLEKDVMELCFKTNFTVNGRIYYKFDEMTPIEKLMYAILLRIKLKIEDDFEYSFFVRPQEKIGNYRVDFLIKTYFLPLSKETESFIIECDGHDFHEKTKEQAKHDKERDRFFTQNNYKVLHYTGSEIYNDFPKIEDELEKYITSVLCNEGC